MLSSFDGGGGGCAHIHMPPYLRPGCLHVCMGWGSGSFPLTESPIYEVFCSDILKAFPLYQLCAVHQRVIIMFSTLKKLPFV